MNDILIIENSVNVSLGHISREENKSAYIIVTLASSCSSLISKS